MNTNLIQFHALEKDWIPSPYPAIQALPDWYKNLAGNVQMPEVPGNLHTVKHCAPFLGAMNCGYIIPLSGDVHFKLDASGKLTFDCPNGDANIETHDPLQMAGSPWAGTPVIKFMNPWIIVTPPGYSTLFLPPLNRQDIPFNVLSGIVDTDNLYTHVNFPAVCLMQCQSDVILRRGTPLVQVIPFKRDDWHSEIHHADAARLNEFTRGISHNHHLYREQMHQKIVFR